MRQFEIFDTLI
uniref:Uncharacterized protein n=1 Tax=Anguilla anguilla TaxID=7936 RepID=A0A0E9Y126_ANGAN